MSKYYFLLQIYVSFVLIVSNGATTNPTAHDNTAQEILEKALAPYFASLHYGVITNLKDTTSDQNKYFCHIVNATLRSHVQLKKKKSEAALNICADCVDFHLRCVFPQLDKQFQTLSLPDFLYIELKKEINEILIKIDSSTGRKPDLENTGNSYNFCSAKTIDILETVDERKATSLLIGGSKQRR